MNDRAVPTDVFPTSIAIRGFTRGSPAGAGELYARTRLEPPGLVIPIDVESRTDSSQRLLFGSARLYEQDLGFTREWLFYPDDLSTAELGIMRRYVERHVDDRGGQIHLLPLPEFLKIVVGRLGYKERARLVFFNGPFDLARLASDWSQARGTFQGGFSLTLFPSIDKEGDVHRDLYRPNVRIKALGSKRERIEFAATARRDPVKGEVKRAYRGRFLDLRQLAFALTDRGYTLDGAAAAFGLEQRKSKVEAHGVISERYIDYNRQDVRTTAELHDRLVDEWTTHPIDLDPERAFSAATVGRSYLRAMGIRPPMQKASGIDDRFHGYAMSAYFGGRAEVRIRRTPVPVRYVDFVSMYPSTFELGGYWSWLTAAGYRVDDATEPARRLLERIDRDALFDRTTWADLAGIFCLVRANGDLLPVRADYGAKPDQTTLGAPTIGLNPLWSEEPLWYTLADVVAAKLLSGRSPVITKAFRVSPRGIQSGLRPVKLRGLVEVDPRADSLFRVAIEERNRIKQTTHLPPEVRGRTSQFLKTLSNADSYGIFAQIDVQGAKAQRVGAQVDGLWTFTTTAPAVESPGPYCFPALAASVTGFGRLLLALLQSEVELQGGSYLACDTDSLLICAGGTGGLIPCPNGSWALPDGRPAIRSLADSDVDEIVRRFDSISPYDREAVPSLLKVEAENLARDGSGRRVDLWAIGISAKRFVLYERVDEGYVIRKASEHGLGLYRRGVRDPKGWSSPWAYWIEIVWRRIIDDLEGRPVAREPDWFSRPAVGQISTTTWALYRPFHDPTAEQGARVRPFNFMLVGHIDPLVPLPATVASSHVTPVAPYSSKPEEFLGLSWRNRVDGQPIAVTTNRRPDPRCARLRTYRDISRDYRFHPERKSSDPGGGVGVRSSAGLLPRRPVLAVSVRHVGKETNELDAVDDGLVDVSGSPQIQYVDERGEWERILPTLRAIGVPELARLTGMPLRTLRSRINSGRLPRREHRLRLMAAIGGLHIGDS